MLNKLKFYLVPIIIIPIIIIYFNEISRQVIVGSFYIVLCNYLFFTKTFKNSKDNSFIPLLANIVYGLVILRFVFELFLLNTIPHAFEYSMLIFIGYFISYYEFCKNFTTNKKKDGGF